MSKTSLNVSKLCNWDCEYCRARKSYIPEGARDIDIKDVIKGINPKVTSIAGGEPGMRSQEFFDEFFKYINRTIVVSTNGLFLKKEYHIRYKNKISCVSYHCVENITDDIELLEYCYDESISPCIVVYSKNINEVEGFLKRYNDIHFRIHLSIGDIPKYKELNLNRKDIQNLFKSLNSIDNYTIHSMKEVLKYYESSK